MPISRRYMRTGSLVFSWVVRPNSVVSSSFLSNSLAPDLEVVPVLVALGPVDDVDAEIREPEVDLVQLVREAHHLLGQHLVDLVVEEIALLLAQLDELLDRGVLLFDGCEAGNRQSALLSAATGLGGDRGSSSRPWFASCRDPRCELRLKRVFSSTRRSRSADGSPCAAPRDRSPASSWSRCLRQRSPFLLRDSRSRILPEPNSSSDHESTWKSGNVCASLRLPDRSTPSEPSGWTPGFCIEAQKA